MKMENASTTQHDQLHISTLQPIEETYLINNNIHWKNKIIIQGNITINFATYNCGQQELFCLC